MAQNRDIKYLGKDFTDFRGQLIEFAKNYFPNTYNDFSPTSPGMMFIEMASYVGDVLSFYQDTQLQETFLQYAKNPANLYNLAYMYGYRPKVVTPSEVEVEITQEVDAIGISPYSPDFSQALIIEQDSIVTSTSTTRTQFYFTDRVDFSFSSSLDPTRVEISSLSGGYPNTYTLTKTAKLTSGEIKETTVSFGPAEKFSTITLEDENITTILSVTGSDGSTWVEVPFLGQETVFTEARNTDVDSGRVFNTLTLTKQPRRFTTRYNSAGKLTLQFGAGVLPGTDESFIPSIKNVGLGTNTGVSRLDYAYDPSNFLYTRSYGLAPSNISLNIKYAVSNGLLDNVPANTVNALTSITNIGPSTKFNTLSINNLKPAEGGSDGDTVEDLRQNTSRAFNEQGRAVTLQDYKVRALSLPPSLGSLAKVFVQQDQLSSTKNLQDSIIDSNPLALTMYVLAYDIDGKLTTTSTTLKNNLKNYLSQYMMLTDSINLRDGFIVNIGIEYQVKIFPNVIARDVLLRCNNALKEYLKTDNTDINRPISLTELQLVLSTVKGVQVVDSVEVVNKAGGNYSNYEYDIKGATRNNVVFPSLDPSIFEVKFPETDIKGRVVI